MEAKEGNDKLIPWPPVVVIVNAGLGRGSDGKMKGLESHEVRAVLEKMVPEVPYRRLIPIYGAVGHLGTFFMVFPDSDMGYVNALTVHDAFRTNGRGRDDWNSQKQKSGDCEKLLYGYLADEQDMLRWDGKKRAVKRWSMESFREKVLKPQQMRPEVSERAKKETEQVRLEADAVQKELEEDEVEMQALRAQLAAINEKVEAEKQRAEEIQKKHEAEMDARRALRKTELEEMVAGFRRVEDQIRGQLKRQREKSEVEILKLEEEATKLATGINRQKEDNERRDKMLKELANHQKLADREKRLAEIDRRQMKALAELRAAHDQRRAELRERHRGLQMEMLQGHLATKGVLDKKINDAEEKVKSQDCVVCFEKLVAPRKKMLYATCGHTCVCDECFPDVWKSSKLCPYCREKQKKEPQAIPCAVFL